MENREILKKIIEDRKSHYPKDFIPGDLKEGVIDEILYSAQFAPNHKKTKPWRFQVFEALDKDVLGEEMAEVYKKSTSEEKFLEKKYLDIQEKVKQSAAVIAISVNFSGLLPEWEEIAATSMAVQNMYLTCTAIGVGCYWSTPAVKDELSKFLNLEENQKCIGFFYIGNI
ncbi:nitroreductase family protein [Halpernia frigidisoli]|uniref:Nitroreductase n=1 Tax=Halpernia frigidisoli TaxID=1125876 RepID=A0A1I3G027_9FLAO|nr:nitroreductase family protein [Halpernia frigidisoli]SFI16848.1 Nitroreductase [Halpernia frigidisoli]